MKNIDLTYKQMLSNKKKTHKITIENIFWYSISVYINLFELSPLIRDIHVKLHRFT